MRANRRRVRREPNRLHRSTERIEDLISWMLGVLLVVAGWAALHTGGWVHDTAAERAMAEIGNRTPVTAVLIEASSPIAGANQSGGVNVPVRWTGPDGVERIDRTVVEGIHAAGETVPAWADRSGQLVPEPTTQAEVTAAAIEVGTLAGVTGSGVVYLIGLGAFRWTGRRYACAWEQEWARVGPEWSRARS